MAVYHEIIPVETDRRVSFEDVTEKVQDIVKQSGIRNGLDMVNAMEKLFPTCQNEGQYLHPGPIHTKNAMELRDEKSEWLLNTDGHLRSVLLGRSETIPLVEGEMTLGEFGRIYFSDMDQTRARERKVRVQVVGE